MLPRRVHVLGAGALGTLFTSHLVRAGVPTTLLCRPSAALPSTAPLTITAEPGDASIVCHVDCEPSDGSGAPIDLLVVATKAFAARDALCAVQSRLHASSEVVLLCNGALAVADSLSDDLQAPLSVATTTHGAWARATRQVHHAGQGETWIGSLPNNEAYGSVGQLYFATHGLGAHLETPAQTERRLWLKLAANAVLNPLTALWDVQNGVVLSREEGRAAATEICRELEALARQITDAPTPTALELEQFVYECAKHNAQNYSSMCVDVRAGRQTEIEQLNGWVEARAQAIGTPCSANARLSAAIRELSASKEQSDLSTVGVASATL